MKLNKYELDYVKYFIQVKGYHHYEVLAEIMDHFILMLEEKKEENPNKPFEDLVNDTYVSNGASMFKEINQSAMKRLTRKFISTFANCSIGLLHYKYVLVMACTGFILYYLQSLYHSGSNYPSDDFQGILEFSKYIFILLGGEFTMTEKMGNRKFMSNKIAKHYGYYLFIIIMIVDKAIIVLVQPITFGYNMYYLISSVILVIQIVILYAIVKAARSIVEESQTLKETYQILE